MTSNDLDDLEKCKTYAELCGTYMNQVMLMTMFYEAAGRQPRDDGCEAVSKALRADCLPRHMWPIPEGMDIDRVIEDLRWKTGWLSRIVAAMEAECRKKADDVTETAADARSAASLCSQIAEATSAHWLRLGSVLWR